MEIWDLVHQMVAHVVFFQHLGGLGSFLVLLLQIQGFCGDPQYPGWIWGEFM